MQNIPNWSKVRKPKGRSKDYVECCNLFSRVSFEHCSASVCMWNKYLIGPTPIVQPNNFPHLSIFQIKISRLTVQHLKEFISEINKHDKREEYIIKGVQNNSQ